MNYHVPDNNAPKTTYPIRIWSIVLWTSLICIPLMVNGLAVMVDVLRGSNPFNGFSVYDMIALGLLVLSFIANSIILVIERSPKPQLYTIKRWVLLLSLVWTIIALYLYLAYTPLIAV